MTKNKPEISVAPMMDWTDRHCRYLHRLISPHARLYTEMVTTGALLHGDVARHLRFSEAEHPVALQLGGSNPDDLARAATLGQDYGYDEINLNCGCPSDRVQNGRFGACLMKEPALVADCVAAMKRAVDIPVTIKCRIGIDEHDDWDFLKTFVDKSVDKGVITFIIHARKAWLNGLSPKENREIPPIDYDRALLVKETYPHLGIVLNGGLRETPQIVKMIGKFDGFMIGREAYSNPMFLAELDTEIHNTPVLSRRDIALKYKAYMRRQHDEHGTPFKSMTRHILGLYHKRPGARSFRRTLSTLPYQEGATETVIDDALGFVE